VVAGIVSKSKPVTFAENDPFATGGGPIERWRREDEQADPGPHSKGVVSRTATGSW